MALIKTFMTPKGACSFWIIGTYWIDNFSKSAYFTLYGFHSREHCDTPGAEFTSRLEYNLPPGNYVYDQYLDSSLVKAEGVCQMDMLYKAVKDFPFQTSDGTVYDFTDAEDFVLGVENEN